MLIAVETIIQAMVYVLQVVPVGTNVGLLRMMWAMSNGSFLRSLGAIHGALAESGFSDDEIQRSWQALGYGSWAIDESLTSWGQQVASANRWRERRYGGYRVICLDLTAFWRSCLQGKVSKHDKSAAQKALPAIVFGVMSISGAIGSHRLPLVSAIIRCVPEMTEAAFRQALLKQIAESDALDTVTVMDAGFGLKELADNQVKRFVLRMAKNCTARRNQLPEQQRGRPAEYGTRIRPLARTHKQKRIPATTIADTSGEFVHQGRTIRYRAWHQLVTSETKVSSTNQTFSLFVFFDPLYTDPLLLATDLTLSAEQLFLIYLDRWTVEHPPLAAKQMIGLHRQFVSADEAKYRLPELALSRNIPWQLHRHRSCFSLLDWPRVAMALLPRNIP